MWNAANYLFPLDIKLVYNTEPKTAVARPGKLMLASRTTARAAVPSEGRRRDTVSRVKS